MYRVLCNRRGFHVPTAVLQLSVYVLMLSNIYVYVNAYIHISTASRSAKCISSAASSGCIQIRATAKHKTSRLLASACPPVSCLYMFLYLVFYICLSVYIFPSLVRLFTSVWNLEIFTLASPRCECPFGKIGRPFSRLLLVSRGLN